MESADSKSGARFERVTIDGDAFVLKHVDRTYDWIARQSGDLACWPIVVWERGLVDLAPPSIDHTIVGAARTTTGGALLMRDASAWLVPADDTPLSLEQHLRFLDHLAEFHVACWGWVDTRRLVADGQPLRPVRSRRARVRGRARPSRAGARASPKRDGGASHASRRRWRPRSAPLRRAPWPLVDALAATPHTFLHGDWKLGNLGSRPDGRTVLIDWSLAGCRTAGRRARALPRVERGAAACRSHEGRRDRGIPRVARTSRRRHRAVVGPPARALPARRHAATRLGEVVRRDRRRARRGGPPGSPPVCGSSGEAVRPAGRLRRRLAGASPWYDEFKTAVEPLTAYPDRLAVVARGARLAEVRVIETAVDLDGSGRLADREPGLRAVLCRAGCFRARRTLGVDRHRARPGSRAPRARALRALGSSRVTSGHTSDIYMS